MHRKTLALPAFSLLIIVLFATFWSFSKEECDRFKSPDGAYEAVITRHRYHKFTPSHPGSGSDYSCFLSIYDTNGAHMGTAPVFMAALIYNDLVWTANGAYIDIRPDGPEWDFGQKTCKF